MQVTGHSRPKRTGRGQNIEQCNRTDLAQFILKEDPMSPRTIYLGKLLGLYCVIVALAMMSHKQTIVDTMTTLVHDAPLLFFVSVIAVLAGLGIVLGHNVWSGGALPIVITIVGWISLI